MITAQVLNDTTVKQIDTDYALIGLAYAIVTQAVEDVYMLQAAGLIRDGQVVVDDWLYSTRKTQGYASPHEVRELILWFSRGYADRLLCQLGSVVSTKAMCQRLKIKLEASE